MVCRHDLRLVVLSILISLMAAFAARELLGRINEARGRRWLAWLAGASIVDGIGTWSMHYTGNLLICGHQRQCRITGFTVPRSSELKCLRRRISGPLSGKRYARRHYTAVTGVTFGSGQALDLSHVIGIWSLGIFGICITPVMVLGVGLITSLADRLQTQRTLLRKFSRQLVEVQELERRHLARELHDEIGQAITAVTARLEDTAVILDRLLGQVRQISLDLRPSMLDDLGLVPTLRSLFDERGRRASVPVRFFAENMPENLDPEIQTTCFRIAQEAITNTMRYAEATQINVDLRWDDRKLRLLMHDNGVGFDVEAIRAQTAGLGLIGITERAALVGGRARIVSSPGEGTTIEVVLPLTLRDERANRGLAYESMADVARE